MTSLLPSNFNPVDYIYINPEIELFSNVQTVEQARDHWLLYGSNMNLQYLKAIPEDFRPRVYITSASNYLESSVYDSNTYQYLTSSNQLDRLAVVHFLRTSNQPSNIETTIRETFNDYIYKAFSKITTIETREDLYVDYLSKRWQTLSNGIQANPVVGVFEDFRLLLENYREASLNVASNLVVNGTAYITGHLRIGEVIIDSNLIILGTFQCSNIETDVITCSNIVTRSNVFIGGDLTVLGTTTTLDTLVQVTDQFHVENAGTGPALFVKQTGSNDVAVFYDDDAVALKIADGGLVGIGTDAPASGFHVVPSARFDRDVSMGPLLYGSNGSIRLPSPSNGLWQLTDSNNVPILSVNPSTGIDFANIASFARQAVDILPSVTFESNVWIRDSASFTSNLVTISASNLIIGSLATFSNLATFRDAVTIDQVATLNSNLVTIQPSTTFSNLATFRDAVAIQNVATLNSNLVTFQPSTTFSNLATFRDAVAIQNVATLNSNLITIQPSTTFSNLVTFRDAIAIQNVATLNSNLITIQPSTTFSNLATFRDTVTIDQVATLNSNLVTFQPSTTFSNLVTFRDAIAIQNVATLNSNLVTFQPSTTFSNLVTFRDALHIDQVATLNSNLVTFQPSTTFSNSVTFRDALHIDQVATLNSNLVTIQPSTTFSNSVTFIDAVSIQDAAILNSNLVTIGASTLVVDSTNATFSNPVTFKDVVNIDRAATFTSNLVTISSTSTSFLSNVTIQQTATFHSNLTTILSATVFSNDVDIVQTASMTSNAVTLYTDAVLNKMLTIDNTALFSSNGATLSVPLVCSNTVDIVNVANLSESTTVFHTLQTTFENPLLVSNAAAISSNQILFTPPVVSSNTLTVQNAVAMSSNAVHIQALESIFSNQVLCKDRVLVQNAATLTSNLVTISASNLVVGSLSTFSNAVSVLHAATIHSNLVTIQADQFVVDHGTTFHESVDFDQTAALSSNACAFYVPTTFAQPVVLNSNLDVEGNTSFEGGAVIRSNLVVESPAIFYNTIHAGGPLLTIQSSNVVITSPVTLSNSLVIKDIAALTSQQITMSTPVSISNHVDVTGNLTSDGSISATLFHMSSDMRIKENIEPLSPTRALDVLQQLSVKEYRLKTDASMIYGLIGQEVERVDSRLIKHSRRMLPVGRVATYVSESRYYLPHHEFREGDELVCRRTGDKLGERVLSRVACVLNPDEFVLDQLVGGSKEKAPQDITRDITQDITRDITIDSKCVNDFVTIDYIQIINLLISAVQSLLADHS